MADPKYSSTILQLSSKYRGCRQNHIFDILKLNEMINNLLLIVLLTLASFSFGQDNSIYDQRLLIHFTEEQLAEMPQQKLEAIIYYYCESYSIDDSHVIGFEIHSFDVSLYEDLRRESVDFSFSNEQGLIITLFAKNKYLPEATLKKS